MTDEKSPKVWKVEKNPRDPLPGGDEGYAAYTSFQKLININNGEVDEEKLQEHFEQQSLIYNWEEIVVTDFSELKLGDRVRYTRFTEDGKKKFVTGGWIISMDDDFHEYIVIKHHSHTNWSLNVKDVERLWVVRNMGQKRNRKPTEITFKRPSDEETKHNSFLPHPETGEDVRVGSFRDSFNKRRFESTDKFQRAQDGEYWRFID